MPPLSIKFNGMGHNGNIGNKCCLQNEKNQIALTVVLRLVGFINIPEEGRQNYRLKYLLCTVMHTTTFKLRCWGRESDLGDVKNQYSFQLTGKLTAG